MTAHEIDWTPLEVWDRCENTLPLVCMNDPEHAVIVAGTKLWDQIYCIDCDFEMTFDPPVLMQYRGCGRCAGCRGDTEWSDGGLQNR